jgi:tyrosyl-tRNA synthetase
MNVEDRLALIREVGEEIVTEEELRQLLQEKPHPVAYDGFEPSGTIHIAQGLLRAINVNKMTRAGVRFKMFVADWHAWANNKMGGDLEKIQTTGRYIQEIWKVTGMDLANVEFVWASEFVTRESYWKKVMNIARDSSLDRVLRTTQIMGRSEKDKLSAAQILYPCMQAADIFELECDITQLGMDQRKVNMLAREVGPKLGLWKPVVVSHHMLMGLQQPPLKVRLQDLIAGASYSMHLPSTSRAAAEELHLVPEALNAVVEYSTRIANAPSVQVAHSLLDEFDRFVLAKINTLTEASLHTNNQALQSWRELQQSVSPTSKAIDEIPARLAASVQDRATAMKMSKSNPDSAIFMMDVPEAVVKKLNKAYCPEKIVDENPVLEYARYIVFERAPKGEVVVERPEKFGGTVTFHSYQEMEASYREGKLHPSDLKKTVAKYVNEFLQPVRDHFEKDEKARKLKEQVESFKVTR